MTWEERIRNFCNKYEKDYRKYHLEEPLIFGDREQDELERDEEYPEDISPHQVKWEAKHPTDSITIERPF